MDAIPDNVRVLEFNYHDKPVVANRHHFGRDGWLISGFFHERPTSELLEYITDGYTVLDTFSEPDLVQTIGRDEAFWFVNTLGFSDEDGTTLAHPGRKTLAFKINSIWYVSDGINLASVNDLYHLQSAFQLNPTEVINLRDY